MTLKKMVLMAAALALAVIAGFALSGCGPPVTGSGELETRELEFSNFTKLRVSHAFEAEVTRDDSFSVSITLDDNLFDYLDVTRIGSTLYIRLKQGRTYLRSTQRASITMPELLSLDLSGASRGSVSGFSSSDALTLDLSGASTLDIQDVKAGRTRLDASGASRVSGSIAMADGNFDLSGASTVELTGTGGDVIIDASGASTVGLANFTVDDANVELSGASRATLKASGTLDANLSGASTLRYRGNPRMGRLDMSGGSTISQD
jgi:hypothetical protein